MKTAADFNATMTDRPLWATVLGQPTIWIRWTTVHEEWVESEQPMTTGNRTVGLTTVGRIVRCGRYGEWCVVDERPRCGRCHGLGQIELRMDRESFEAALLVAIELDQGRRGVDAALFQMWELAVECPACLDHPGWVAA